MKKVAVILAEGFEEIEALSVVDVIRRRGFVCDMLSINDTFLLGCHNIMVKADNIMSLVDIDSYDMIVLPGGLPGADNLRDSEEVISLVNKFAANPKKYVAAICAAPQVFEKSSIDRDTLVTSYPTGELKNTLKDFNYVDDNGKMDEMVVVSKNIITSRGPASALSFAYKLVEILGGDTQSLKVGMLYNDFCDSIRK